MDSSTFGNYLASEHLVGELSKNNKCRARICCLIQEFNGMLKECESLNKQYRHRIALMCYKQTLEAIQVLKTSNYIQGCVRSIIKADWRKYCRKHKVK